MSAEPSVLVVGAGPTGLTLAAELASAGIQCHLVDKRPEPTRWSRAFGLMPRTMEALAMRGQIEPFVEAGLPCAEAPLGDDRGHLDYTRLDSTFPFILILPQYRTEELLTLWALKAGVQLRRGVAFRGLRQNAEGVTAELEHDGKTRTEHYDYVVGCDGVNSAVRLAASIPFSGRDYDKSLVIADVRLTDRPASEVYARIARRGMVARYPFGDGTYRLIVLDRQRMHVPTTEPVTAAELEQSCLGIAGLPLRVRELVWQSRFRSSQKHAQNYRRGRVLLAGDAAHTHIPSGGQGLQVGIQDAMNLAWKLAAELAGWAPPWLLDSYERERLPIAAATLRKTDLAFRFETSNSVGAQLTRWLTTKSMSVRRLQLPVMREFAGLTVRYPAPEGAGPAVGRRVPDLTLRCDAGRGPHPVISLYSLLRDRQFVLIDQTSGGAGAQVALGWPDRVRAVRAQLPETRLPELVLVRPDGYVAWAGSGVEQTRISAALREWCGRERAS